MRARHYASDVGHCASIHVKGHIVGGRGEMVGEKKGERNTSELRGSRSAEIKNQALLLRERLFVLIVPITSTTSGDDDESNIDKDPCVSDSRNGKSN